MALTVMQGTGFVAIPRPATPEEFLAAVTQALLDDGRSVWDVFLLKLPNRISIAAYDTEGGLVEEGDPAWPDAQPCAVASLPAPYIPAP